jgi:hypothetical protein
MALLSRGQPTFEEGNHQHRQARLRVEELDHHWRNQTPSDVESTDFRAYVESRMAKS